MTTIFLDVDINKLEKKIKKDKFKLLISKTMSRYIIYGMFKSVDKIKLVDNGNERILSYIGKSEKLGKVISSSSFKDINTFLSGVVYFQKNYREFYYKIWEKDDMKILIQYWPGLSPIIFLNNIDYLTFLNNIEYKIIYGDVENVYHHKLKIPVEIMNTIPKITFENIDEVINDHSMSKNF